MIKKMAEKYESINNLKPAKFARQNSSKKFFLKVENGEVFYCKKDIDSELNDPILSTKFGTFYCEDNGEFGGNLYMVDGRNYQFCFFGNFKDLIPYGDGLLYIDSCAHMMGQISYGFITKENDELILKPMEHIYGESFLKAEIIDGDIYILLTDGLYRFDSGLVQIAKPKSDNYVYDVYVGNFVINDGKYYVGLSNRIQVTDMKTGKTEYLKE